MIELYIYLFRVYIYSMASGQSGVISGQQNPAEATCPAAQQAAEAGSPCAQWNQATWGVPAPCSPPGGLFKDCRGLYKCGDDGQATLVADRPRVGDPTAYSSVQFASNEEAVTGGLGILGECAARGEIKFDPSSEACYGSKQPGDFKVDLCGGPMSEASVDRTQDRTQETMANLKHLQSMEKDMYQRLEVLNANGAPLAEQQKVMKEVAQVADMRISLFKGLSDMYAQTQENVAQTRVDLVDQLTVIGVVNAELDNARAQLEELKDARTGKVRMAEINTYYGKRYRAHTSLMKLIVFVCLPALVIVVLQKRGLIPASIGGPLLAIILGVGIILIILRVFDLSRRNNMNYDEYDWFWDAQANHPTVVEYDVQQMKKSTVGKALADGVEQVADTVGQAFEFCVGDHCCGSGTSYNHKKQQCTVDTDDGTDDDEEDDDDRTGGRQDAGRLPTIQPTPFRAVQSGREGFDPTYAAKTSFVPHPPPSCGWREEATVVKAHE